MHVTIRPDLDQRHGESAELNQCTVGQEQRAKLPGPPATTLKLDKPGWRPRSASAAGCVSADLHLLVRQECLLVLPHQWECPDEGSRCDAAANASSCHFRFARRASRMLGPKS